MTWSWRALRALLWRTEWRERYTPSRGRRPPSTILWSDKMEIITSKPDKNETAIFFSVFNVVRGVYSFRPHLYMVAFMCVKNKMCSLHIKVVVSLLLIWFQLCTVNSFFPFIYIYMTQSWHLRHLWLETRINLFFPALLFVLIDLLLFIFLCNFSFTQMLFRIQISKFSEKNKWRNALL